MYYLFILYIAVQTKHHKSCAVQKRLFYMCQDGIPPLILKQLRLKTALGVLKCVNLQRVSKLLPYETAAESAGKCASFDSSNISTSLQMPILRTFACANLRLIRYIYIVTI